MFQPLRPLSGLMVWSGELTTFTTSPICEWLKNHAPSVDGSPAPLTSGRPMQPWLVLVLPKMPLPQ
ncbi:hypothetical protein SAZ_27325 [Streptomyces noursei ZPM]|nr:hypothetical protein SAZ_27325 [Streptomyces noursei ZPM]